MNDGLFDTVILIDHLNGIPAAGLVLAAYPGAVISIITWIEVLTGAKPDDEARTRSLLSFFRVLPLTPEIAERAASVRRSTRLKLPDAIILATAEIEHRTLITRNTRDFSDNQPGIHIPYRL